MFLSFFEYIEIFILKHLGFNIEVETFIPGHLLEIKLIVLIEKEGRIRNFNIKNNEPVSIIDMAMRIC